MYMYNLISGVIIGLVLISVLYMGSNIGSNQKEEAMCAHIKHELKVESRLCKEAID